MGQVPTSKSTEVAIGFSERPTERTPAGVYPSARSLLPHVARLRLVPRPLRRIACHLRPSGPRRILVRSKPNADWAPLAIAALMAGIAAGCFWAA